MKILHTVEFYHPSQGGAQEVVKQLSERMVASGHEVTVATSKLASRKKKNINGVKIEEFDISGNLVRGIKGEAKRYQDFLASSKFDVVMNYAAQQWTTDLMFEVLDKVKARKIIVPCGYSALKNPEYREYFKKLPAYLKKYDASVYLSPTYRDIKFAKKNKIKKIFVITNGASENEFKDIPDKKIFRRGHGVKHFFLLTIGNHTGSKGHAETLEVYARFSFPSTLVIIGQDVDDGCFEQCLETADFINSTQAHLDKKVLVLSLSREETVNALKSADLFIFLSNIEASPLVLFESAAAGAAFIASAAGNSEEIAEWTQGGLITKTVPYPGRANDMTVDINVTLDLMQALRTHDFYRRKLGRLGRSNWESKFTWNKISEQYLKLYEGKL